MDGNTLAILAGILLTLGSGGMAALWVFAAHQSDSGFGKFIEYCQTGGICVSCYQPHKHPVGLVCDSCMQRTEEILPQGC